jgi:hypothetical protein
MSQSRMSPAPRPSIRLANEENSLEADVEVPLIGRFCARILAIPIPRGLPEHSSSPLSGITRKPLRCSHHSILVNFFSAEATASPSAIRITVPLPRRSASAGASASDGCARDMRRRRFLSDRAGSRTHPVWKFHRADQLVRIYDQHDGIHAAIWHRRRLKGASKRACWEFIRTTAGHFLGAPSSISS